MLMPNLTDLQISLFDEADVDFIITHMPQLEYLNNLAIDQEPSVCNEASENRISIEKRNETASSKLNNSTDND